MKTNITFASVLIIISVLSGCLMGYFYAMNEINKTGYVHLEETHSGTFFIKNKRIYSVSELETEKMFNGSLGRSKE